MSPAAKGDVFSTHIIHACHNCTTAPVHRSLPASPPELTCPITQELLTDPVILNESGQTYERSAIQQWLYKGNLTDPLTGAAITSTALSNNWALKKVISSYLEASSLPGIPCSLTAPLAQLKPAYFPTSSVPPAAQQKPSPAHHEGCALPAEAPSTPLHSQYPDLAATDLSPGAVINNSLEAGHVHVSQSPDDGLHPPHAAASELSGTQGSPELESHTQHGTTATTSSSIPFHPACDALPPAVLAAPNTDALPSAVLAAPNTDALPPAALAASNTDALPPAALAAHNTDALAPAVLAAPNTDALHPTGQQAASDTDALPLVRHVALDTDALPLVRHVAPDNYVLPEAAASSQAQAGQQHQLQARTFHGQETAAVALHEAAAKGDVEAVQQLLALHPTAPDTRCDRFGTTPLHAAALGGWHQVVDILLDHGANPLALDRDDSRTALHIAACMGHTAVVCALLRRNVPIDIRDRDGATALLLASTRGHADAVADLMAAGADWAATDNDNLTALHHACAAADERVVCALLRGGCPTNMPMHDAAALPPLTLAVMRGAEPVVRLLLDAGAEVDTIDCQQCNALLRAINAGDLQLVRFLIERGADIGALRAVGKDTRMPHLAEVLPVLLESPLLVRLLRGDPELEWSPLVDAVRQGDTASLHLLLQQSWPEQCGDVFSAALCEAVARGDAVMAGTLASCGHCCTGATGLADRLLGALAQVKDASAVESLLLSATLQQHLECASQAAVYGAVADGCVALVCALMRLKLLDVTACTGEDNRTALFSCTTAAVARELLAAGADVNMRDLQGRTPLMACSQPEVVCALLEAGADVTAADMGGHTALSAAATSGDHAKLRLLLNYCLPVSCTALVTAVDSGGCTPLHLAAAAVNGGVECLYLLLHAVGTSSARTEVNRLDAQGRTPLLHAVVAGSHCSAQYLIQRGAQVSRADKQGRTAAGIAAAAGDVAMLQQLLARGAELDASTAVYCLEQALLPESEPLTIILARHLKRMGQEGQLRGRWLLARACQQQMLDLAACLLRCGVAVDEVDAEGNTALHQLFRLGADQSTALECAQLLLDHGAPLHTRNHQGATPLHLAAQAPNPTVLSALLRHTPLPTLWALQSHHPTPLQQAAARHQPHNITAILSHLHACLPTPTPVSATPRSPEPHPHPPPSCSTLECPSPTLIITSSAPEPAPSP